MDLQNYTEQRWKRLQWLLPSLPANGDAETLARAAERAVDAASLAPDHRRFALRTVLLLRGDASIAAELPDTWPRGKLCRKCGRYEPAVEFGRDSTKRDGKASNCLDCKRDKCRRWYANNTERHRANMRLAKALERHDRILAGPDGYTCEMWAGSSGARLWRGADAWCYQILERQADEVRVVTEHQDTAALSVVILRCVEILAKRAGANQ